MATEVAYPFIYKKHEDEWGLHSRIVRTPEEMAGLEPPARGEVRFKQEYVVGHIEYVTHMLAVDGEPRYALTFEHGFDSDHFIKGRWAHYISHTEVETPIMDVLGGILKSLRYTGTCCFNYKFANGVPKILRDESALRRDADGKNQRLSGHLYRRARKRMRHLRIFTTVP